MMAMRKPCTLQIVTAKGEVQTLHNVVQLGVQFYAGTRNVKLENGEIRRIRDVLIIAFNDMEVYL